MTILLALISLVAALGLALDMSDWKKQGKFTRKNRLDIYRAPVVKARPIKMWPENFKKR